MSVPLPKTPTVIYNKPENPSAYGDSILQEFPGFKNVYTNGVEVYNPNDQRLNIDPQMIEGRQSEFYYPGEKGGGQSDMLPNPGNSSKAVIEIFDKNTANSPALKKDLIIGELLHGMKKDPYYAQLRNEFANNFSEGANKAHQRLSKDKSSDFYAYPGESIKQMMDRSGTDAYLRGYFMKNTPGQEEWVQHYTPKQMEIVKKMEHYLRTGKKE